MINDFFLYGAWSFLDSSFLAWVQVYFSSWMSQKCAYMKAVHVIAETFPVGRNWSGTSNWTELPPEIMYMLYYEINEIIILFGSSGEGPESYGVNMDLSQPLQWFGWNSY